MDKYKSIYVLRPGMEAIKGRRYDEFLSLATPYIVYSKPVLKSVFRDLGGEFLAYSDKIKISCNGKGDPKDLKNQCFLST